MPPAGRFLDPLDVSANCDEAVQENLEVDFDAVRLRIYADVGDATHRHAPVSDRARDLQAADVFPGVGHSIDHFAAPQSLNEEQRRREDYDQSHYEEQAKSGVAFLNGHPYPP